MQITSEDYKTEIKKPSRDFECKITIGNNIYTNNDIVDIILETVQPQEGFSIGNTPSQTLDLTLLNRGDTIYSTSQVKVEIGLKIGSTIEYILMGYFNIDDIEKTDYTTKFTCYDNMIKFETPYFSSLTYSATLQQVANELATKTGVQFTGSLPAYNVKKLEGFTCREILGYMASICGGNAAITRDGKFTVVYPKDINYSICADNYFDYKREEVKYKIGKVSCKTEDKELNKGSLGTDSMEIQFENPWVNESILNDIYTKLNGFSYLGYSMKWQGDLALDPGDIVAITDKKGIVRKVPILSQKFTYTGGLTTEIGAKGETKNKNSFSSNGHGSNKLDRVVTELLIVNEALIDKANIQQLEAVSIRTQSLEVKTAKVETAIIDVAHISDLTAINANIERLIATDATIGKAIIGKADIVDLKATNGKITLLETKVGSIDTILSKEIFVELATAGKIVAGSSIIAEGAIGSAQISSLSATKLSAGIIDAAVITVKNLNADNITVGSINGQRIANGAIDNSKVANNANIAGSKLNINDVIVNINGATTQINGTKIQVGDRTLDLELSTQKISLEENKTNISKQQATITAMDSAIKLKVDNQTFNTFKSTTDGSIGVINTTLNKNTASIDVLQKQITLKVEQTNIDKSIKDLVIGNRNLFVLKDVGNYKGGGHRPLEPSIEIKYNSINVKSNPDDLVGCKIFNMGQIITICGSTNLNRVDCYARFGQNPQIITSATVLDGKFEVSLRVPNDTTYMILGLGEYPYKKPYFLSEVTVVNGSKVLSWTPAPEDTDQAIQQVDEKIDTKVSEINTTLGGIDLRVTSSEGNIRHTDGKLSLLDTRVKQAEIKITDEAIVYTVRNSSAYKSDLINKANQTDMVTAQSQIVQMSNKLDLNVSETSNLKGIVTNHTSSITLLSNQISTKVDANGVISITTQNAGSIISSFSKTGEVVIKNGNFSIEHANGGKMFWVQGGRISAAALDLYAVADGTFKIYGPGAKGVQLISENDKEIYIDFKRSGTAPYNGRISMPKSDQLAYIAPSHYFASTTGTTKLTVQGSLFAENEVYATNKLEGNTLHTRSGYITSNTTIWLTDPTLKGFVNLRVNTIQSTSMVVDTGYITSDKALWFTDPTFSTLRDINVRTAICHGAKPALVDTKSYGKTFVFAEESTSIRLSDYGEGVIGNDGLCYVHLEPQYMETVTTNNSNYKIHLTSWVGCGAEILSKYPSYFVVKGNVDKKFEWKVIADRKGYENMRFNEAMEANNCVGGI